MGDSIKVQGTFSLVTKYLTEGNSRTNGLFLLNRIDHHERENRGEWSIPVGGCEVVVCSQDTQTISLNPDSLIS